MRQGRLDHLPGMVRLLGRPVPEAGPETVRHGRDPGRSASAHQTMGCLCAEKAFRRARAALSYVAGLLAVPAPPAHRPCRSRPLGGGGSAPPLFRPLVRHRGRVAGAPLCAHQLPSPFGGRSLHSDPCGKAEMPLQSVSASRPCSSAEPKAPCFSSSSGGASLSVWTSGTDTALPSRGPLPHLVVGGPGRAWRRRRFSSSQGIQGFDELPEHGGEFLCFGHLRGDRHIPQKIVLPRRGDEPINLVRGNGCMSTPNDGSDLTSDLNQEEIKDRQSPEFHGGLTRARQGA